MVFSLPFSATAVANIGSAGAASGVQATIVFGSLWMLREGPKSLKKSGLWNSEHMRTSIRQLRFFMFVVVLSLLVPLWINGRFSVDCTEPSCSGSTPVTFSVRHITQTMYLAYGIILTIFIAFKNSDLRQFRESIRVFLISAIFVSFWGFLQWYCYRAGISYPAFVFNNSATESAMGYLEDLDDLGLTRISSVATEPSILAQYTLIALVFAIFAVFGQRVVISKFWDRMALTATVLVLVLTTSSTAYLGLAILLPVSLLALWYLGRLGARPFVIFGLALLGSYAFYARSQLIQEVADRMIFSKAEGFSGMERLNSVVLAVGYFRVYPILGIGWGSATSYDLIFKLLSNTGVLGLLAFALFVKNLFLRLWRAMVRQNAQKKISERTYWACCLLVASFILVVTNELTGFSFVYGHLWFVFGMAIAVPIFRDPSLETHSRELQTVSP